MQADELSDEPAQFQEATAWIKPHDMMIQSKLPSLLDDLARKRVNWGF